MPTHNRRELKDARPLLDVEVCDVPDDSVIERRWVEAAFFKDAYCAPVKHQDAGVVDLFFAVFGHHPLWMKRLLIARNRLAVLCGLDAPAPMEIMRPQRKPRYLVGDKIGPWPIFHLDDHELVAGRDNKHLDFRLSVLRQGGEGAQTVVISTVCHTHNLFGVLYLLIIIPFHRRGVRLLMNNAVTAGRL